MSGIFDTLLGSWNDDSRTRKEVPEGKHIATVRKVSVQPVEDHGNRISFELYFPEFNAVEWDNVLITEKTGRMIRDRFEAMGYEDLTPADLPKIMGGINGVKVTITKKKKQDSKYYNYYWNKADNKKKTEDVPF